MIFFGINFRGASEFIPVAGDRDDDGVDTVGFFVPSILRWNLKNDFMDGWTNFIGFNFGGPADAIPVAGDWE